MIEAPLKSLLKTVSRYETILANNGILSVKDFLNYFPRTYEDRSSLSLVKHLDATNNEVQSVVGQIVEKKALPRGRKKLYEVRFHDVDGDE